MPSALVTIVVTPRERFSHARTSLDNLLENVPADVPIVYVDGASPPRVRRHLEARARQWQFKLLRTDYYLTPNEARNLGLNEAPTRYVVFIDNDVITSRGWLESLVDCAEETGAWVVGPLCCIGDPAERIIHMAGGEAQIREERGRRILHEWHRYEGERVLNVVPQLQREPTEVVEFHCMLVRREAFDRLGPLDEGLLSVHEHVDFCMSVRDAGGAVYIEPASVVTYVAPPPFAWSDLPYYLLRWSDLWSRASYRHANAKWKLDDDHWAIQERFVRPHRRLALARLERWAERIAGKRIGARAVDLAERIITRRSLRRRSVGRPQRSESQ